MFDTALVRVHGPRPVPGPECNTAEESTGRRAFRTSPSMFLKCFIIHL